MTLRTGEAMRVLGHRILDDTLDSPENLRNSPVWETITESLFKKTSEPIPLEPQGAERAYQDLREIQKVIFDQPLSKAKVCANES